ncbi:MAG: AAA family ATPase, partial [Actinomycetota bacterium]
MPLSNRLKIWTPRIVAVLALYLIYLWAYQASATCLTVCTAHDANGAILHGLAKALPYVLLGLAFVSLGVIEIVAMFWMMARGRSYIVYPHEYDVTFEDVRGQEPVVDSVRDVVKLFRGFREFKELGGSPPKGILLEGPPGTGKTLLAKAVAGTVGVPFIYTSATSFATMFMGAGNLRVMALFRKAK